MLRVTTNELNCKHAAEKEAKIEASKMGASSWSEENKSELKL